MHDQRLGILDGVSIVTYDPSKGSQAQLYQLSWQQLSAGGCGSAVKHPQNTKCKGGLKLFQISCKEHSLHKGQFKDLPPSRP
jgi:hypothetical protein